MIGAERGTNLGSGSLGSFHDISRITISSDDDGIAKVEAKVGAAGQRFQVRYFVRDSGGRGRRFPETLHTR